MLGQGPVLHVCICQSSRGKTSMCDCVGTTKPQLVLLHLSQRDLGWDEGFQMLWTLAVLLTFVSWVSFLGPTVEEVLK